MQTMLPELLASEEGLVSKILGNLNADDLCRVAQTCTKLKVFAAELRSKRKFISSRMNTGTNLHPGGSAVQVRLIKLRPRPFGERDWAGTLDAFVNIATNATGEACTHLLSKCNPGDPFLVGMFRVWVAAWEYFPGELELLNETIRLSSEGSGMAYWLTDEWRRRLDEYHDVCIRDVDSAVEAASNLRLILIQSFLQYGYCLPMPAWSAMERFGMDAYYTHKSDGEKLEVSRQQELEVPRQGEPGNLFLSPSRIWGFQSFMVIVDPNSKTYKSVAASMPLPEEDSTGSLAEETSSAAGVRNTHVLAFICPGSTHSYLVKHKPKVSSEWEGKVSQEILDGLVWLKQDFFSCSTRRF